jgi:hypothetical protein
VAGAVAGWAKAGIATVNARVSTQVFKRMPHGNAPAPQTDAQPYTAR